MSKSRRLLAHLAAICCSLGLLLPLYWGFVASLGATNAPPPASVNWWAEAPQWQNYSTVFELIPMRRYLANSTLVVLWAVPLTLLTASLAGFSMIQLPVKSQRLLLALSIAWLIVPGTAVWIYRFQIFKWLGLLNSQAALIAPAAAAGSPLYVLLYYWSFRQIPLEIYQAARLDGANAWQIWWYIGSPLVKSTSVAVTVLSFALFWNDFVSPTLYLNDSTKYTAAIGLQFLQQLDRSNWPILMAGAIIVLLPVLLLFLLLQRYFSHDMSLARLNERNW